MWEMVGVAKIDIWKKIIVINCIENVDSDNQFIMMETKKFKNGKIKNFTTTTQTVFFTNGFFNLRRVIPLP